MSVARAFWWGFHIELSHEELDIVLGAIDVTAGLATTIGPSTGPAAPYIAIIAKAMGAASALLKTVDQGHGVYISMLWLLPGAFVPTPVPQPSAGPDLLLEALFAREGRSLPAGCVPSQSTFTPDHAAYGDFFYAHLDNDLKRDLVFVMRKHAGSGFIELHAVSGASNFTEATHHVETPLTLGHDPLGDFFMVDTNKDGKDDLVFLMRRHTGSGKIEVHVISASQGFKGFELQTAVPLDKSEDTNGDFFMADFDPLPISVAPHLPAYYSSGPDLFFLKRRNVGSGFIEVHIVSGVGNFQNFLLQTSTPLDKSEDNNGDFFLADYNRDGIPDLYFIKRRNVGSGSIEVHVLSGASKYQTFSLQTGTALPQSLDNEGQFFLADIDRDGIPDLVFVKNGATPGDTQAIRVLSGASNYQTFLGKM